MRTVFIILLALVVTSFSAFGDDGAGNKPVQPDEPPAMDGKTMTDIHDIKPLEIVARDYTWLFYILGAVPVVILLVLLFICLRKRWPRRKKRPVITLTPDEAAHMMLDELMEVEFMEGKEFYFRLSGILREYVKGRFGINAPEMTTEEFLPGMEALRLEGPLMKDIRTFCAESDPIKFAGVPAVEKKMESDLVLVRKIVTHTTPSPEEEEEKDV